MRKLLVGVLVLVMLLVGAVFAADRPIRGEVERRVAADLRTSVPFTDTPVVELGGYPIGWHLATGWFPLVRVRAAGMPVRLDPHAIELRDVTVRLTDVQYTPQATRAATVKGSARLTYDDLSKLAGVPVSHADGRLAATYTTEVFGQRVEATVTGVPVVDRPAQTLGIVDADVRVAGFSLGAQASQALIRTLVKPVPLALQYGLRVDVVSPAADGLLVGFGGTDVEFPGAR